MKKLLKPLFALALAAITFTSCMKNDNIDLGPTQLEQEKSLDSLLRAEKIKIEDYLAANNSSEWERDTVKLPLPLLGKSPERGIWYQILVEPTEENDKAYEYKTQQYQNGVDIAPPTVKIKYTAQLLNGTEVQSDEEGSSYSFSNPNYSRWNNAWRIIFYPYTVKNAGDNINFGYLSGLTENGLKKGSKIRVVTPSLWAFGNKKNGDIPADSPLVYEFEVLSIQ